MCYPALLAALGTTGAATGTTAAAAGTAAAGTAAAGTAAAGAGAAAGAAGAAAGTAAGAGAVTAGQALAGAALKAGVTAGAGLLAGKLLSPKLPGMKGDAPPENTDPSGNVASLDARRRAKVAGGRQSTLLTRNTGPVTPTLKTLLGS